ncbi:LacI family DNA-binding transcriptional regulator [Gracilibacillus alcaliphilus]|uniref:LacI family DNA-binding transcriptional regulator n=1 Tax=Gracilibacillus alcaliphilus TaxID=1401441 RepID=UPI00195EABB4|nr:LacI family DNA-binding transcriptional regulator [Gracilibacillus alcaliphilus]MBM7676457.1 LacI family transcriptional regulator [Gracilibacillus alcaliphilus]
MVTIYDIAKKSGYSITTVSKVLNDYANVSEKAKRKVLAAVEELGYTPNSSARTLATSKSWMIGVVFAEHLGVGMAHPFFSEVIESFKKHIELYNYDLLFISRRMGLKEETYKHLRHRGVDGVVVVQSLGEDALDFTQFNMPTVFIDMPEKGAISVYSDNQQGSMLAVEYLYELGHRKIAHIMGAQTMYTALERTIGYKVAMEKLGLVIPDHYIADGGYYSYEGGREAMLRLLLLPDRPTAVYVSGDVMALGAIRVIREAGLRVPDDISVIGFDDLPIANHVDPPLTTIRQDKELIGKQAAIVLLDEINQLSKKSRKDKIIPVQLIKRDSCQRLSENEEKK